MNLPNMNEARKRSKDLSCFIDYKFDDKYIGIGNGKTYHVKTYGCQMNEHDSENIKALLESMGFVWSDDLYMADVIVLNTCSIRENANNKVFGLLGRIKHMKQTRKDVIVGLCGCMMQEEHVCEEIISKYKWLDFVVGTHNIEKICEMVYESLTKKELKIDVKSIEGDVLEDLPVRRDSKIKAYVNIQLGCDKFCTYCIVPYTRGKQRSRKKEDILKEVDNLIKEGYLEITLLGQNVNAYGKDLYDNYTLANLLEDIAKKDVPRIKFITSHPWDFTDEMIEVIKKNDNILNYIHLPVQSGSSAILKKMGRRYSKEEYLSLVEKIRKEIPNVTLTTDIIVGFPSETDDDFEDTLDVVRKCEYDLAYTFIFSKRVGTPAYNMEDNTPLIKKEERLKKLNELVNEFALINNKKLVNTISSVLVEGYSEKNSDLLMGYTEGSKLVNFKGPEDIIGKIVKVKIIDAKTWSLDGEYIK